MYTLEFYEDEQGREPVRIVLLLAGYDKGERPSARHQQAQIALAGVRLKSWKERQKG